ncbi:MAG TPA: hypothetical protein VMB80_00095 [Candidatus Acidoferrum sp.]|nr:hypothetical protein [Candidatus Acidoferrum sp.]
MKNALVLLTVGFLMTGTFSSWADQTQVLYPGFNFLTCQVAPGGNINDTSFLEVPPNFPSNPNDPPTAIYHAVYYHWDSSSGYTAYYYFNKDDASTWIGSASPAGWYKKETGELAPVTWSPGQGDVIELPCGGVGPQTITFHGINATSANRWPSFPNGWALRGSPTPGPVTPGIPAATPADIVSAAPVDGDAIYVYKGTGCAFPSFPADYTCYYFNGFLHTWIPVTPHILPNYRAVWLTHGITSGIIEGTVRQGANCSSSQPPLQNWAVIAASGGNVYYGISDANGHYAIQLPSGVYSVHSFAPPASWTELCGGGAFLNVTVGNVYPNNDFWEKAPANDNGMSMDQVAFFPYPLRSPCWGQNMTYVMTYRNGNVPRKNVLLVLYLPWVSPGFTFVSESAPSTPTQSGVIPSSKLTQVWNLGPLAPLASGMVTFTITLPTSSTYTGGMNGVAWLNYDSHYAGSWSVVQRVTCSHDPNDMQVNPAGCGPQGYIPAGQPLTYLIRFQNTGTAPAYQVVVSNLLSADLDLSTLQVLGSSHPNVLQVEGHQLVWTFPNIALRTQSDDDLGSQGYIKYQVSPLTGAPVGTVITNNAQVFFDLNAPITTVTTTNTITADPVPVASFTVTPAIGSAGHTNSFTYTGGSAGATYLWAFGPDATPATSTEQNPSNVVFATEGDKLVLLEVTIGDCTSDPAMQVVTVGVPTLNAQVIDDQLMLSWSGAGYHLQETGDLQSGSAWTATTSATVSQFDSHFTATLPIPGNNTFYRLSQVSP